MNKYEQGVVDYLTKWHGTDTDSCAPSCEIKKALVLYGKGELTIYQVIAIADDIDDGWKQSYGGPVPAGTIDCTPTWSAMLPVMLIQYLHQETVHQGYDTDVAKQLRKDILSHFERMATLADLWAERMKDINSRIISVDDNKTTIGEFISHNTQDGIINMEQEDIDMVYDIRPGEMITIGGGASGETIIVRPDEETSIPNTPFVQHEGWVRHKITDTEVKDLCFDETPNHLDHTVCILISTKRFWIRQHASGKYSTEALRESAYGSFASCVKCIEETMGEKTN